MKFVHSAWTKFRSLSAKTQVLVIGVAIAIAIIGNLTGGGSEPVAAKTPTATPTAAESSAAPVPNTPIQNDAIVCQSLADGDSDSAEVKEAIINDSPKFSSMLAHERYAAVDTYCNSLGVTTAVAETMMPASQRNAVETARQYLDTSGFSREGLIEQLSSSAGSGFPRKDAVFAVDYLKVDWNAQAAQVAQEYLDTSSFSRQGLIEQLESSAGSGFTHAQAVYGVNKSGL